MDLMVEATPRRVFANAHTYHINSISVNSDYETYMSADDLRINLWNFEITNQSFSILWRAAPCGPWDGPSLAKSSNKGGASSGKWDVRALGPLTCKCQWENEKAGRGDKSLVEGGPARSGSEGCSRAVPVSAVLVTKQVVQHLSWPRPRTLITVPQYGSFTL